MEISLNYSNVFVLVNFKMNFFKFSREEWNVIRFFVKSTILIVL
jgi:hypothetical protein